MNKQGFLNPGFLGPPVAAAGIQLFLLYFAFFALVVSGAPLRGALFAVGNPAPKGTVNIGSCSIARVGQKENAAVPASLQAWLQMGMCSDHATKLA